MRLTAFALQDQELSDFSSSSSSSEEEEEAAEAVSATANISLLADEWDTIMGHLDAAAAMALALTSVQFLVVSCTAMLKADHFASTTAAGMQWTCSHVHSPAAR